MPEAMRVDTPARLALENRTHKPRSDDANQKREWLEPRMAALVRSVELRNQVAPRDVDEHTCGKCQELRLPEPERAPPEVRDDRGSDRRERWEDI